MKKQLFISIQYLEIGGVERSLLGLLDSLDYSRFDVDLFIHHHSGELMPYISSKVNLLPEIPIYTTITRPIIQIVREGYWKIAFGRLKAKFQARQFEKLHTDGENNSIFQYVADSTTPYLPQINNKNYDLAISFLAPHNIVRDKVNAKYKLAWIHTDYSNVAIDVERELKVWSTFDHIAAISEEAKKSIHHKIPDFSR